MKAKRLDEIRAFLGSDEFRGWWVDLAQTREAFAEATRRYEELLEEATLAALRADVTQKDAIDTLYASGACEDEGARLIAEASAVENHSMEALATFEEQRFRASDAWFKLGALDKNVEELKERIAGASRQSEGTPEVHRLESELQRAVREQRGAHELYERENARKTVLWNEVESMWARSMELSLVCSEKQAKAVRVKRDAEHLFHEAEQHKLRAARLREASDALALERERLEGFLEGLFVHARQKFDCVVGDDFLYWGSRENNKLAWCVALIADEGSYNMEVAPLAVYHVSTKEGVRRIAPVPPEGIDLSEADERIEGWFRDGRVEARVSTDEGD